MDRQLKIERYFFGKVFAALSKADSRELCEIRLREGAPLALTLSDRTVFLCENGSITSDKANALYITGEDIRHSFEAVCRYSVHSFQNQISQCFITIAGGHRVGICGTAVYSKNGMENIKYISGLNFRIAREVIGAADRIMDKIMSSGLKSVLIFGAPSSGKTTILRDLCRSVGNRIPVSVIDERGELAAVSGGSANNDVGVCTDVFNGFSKSDGIIAAIRVMSPKMIFCDEIGSAEDISAIRLAADSGVLIAASIHCSSPSQLTSRKDIRELIEDGIFDYCVHTEDKRITRIYSRSRILASGEEKAI